MPTGKILAANDEWTLSTAAFQHPQTGTSTVRYLRNIALWFTGGIGGRFLVYTNDSVAIGDWIAQELQQLGHEVVPMGGFQGPFTLENLQQYQAIFLVEQAADNNVLIEYVNGGGCVYVAGGGGYEANRAASRWNVFLNRFDLQFASTTNGRSGILTPFIEHPVFEGVTALYQDNGNSLSFSRSPSVYSDLLSVGVQNGPLLSGAFALTDLDRYELQNGTSLDLSHILMDHRLETTDSSQLKLQLYNGSSTETANTKATVTIHGPYQKSDDPNAGTGAPIAQNITADPAMIDFQTVTQSDWSSVQETRIETQGAEAGEYMLNLTLEYETGRPMSELHAVQFRVKRG